MVEIFFLPSKSTNFFFGDLKRIDGINQDFMQNELKIFFLHRKKIDN